MGPGAPDPKESGESRPAHEERWQFVIESNGDGIWDWNVQTNEVFFSTRWKEMLGYGEDDIEGRLDEWATRVHPDDIEWVTRELQRHFSEEVPFYAAQHRVKCKDGTYKWILARGKVVSRTEDRKPLRMVGTHEDITALRWSEQRFRSLFETSKDSILLVNRETGRILMANPAACTLYGYSREEFLTMKATDVSGEPEKTSAAVLSLASQIPFRLHKKKDGTIFPVEISGSYFREGALELHTAFIRDITERKRFEEALQQANDRLESGVRERTRELQDAYDALTEKERSYRNLFENASVGMFQARADGKGLLRVNKAFSTMLGYESPEELISAISDTAAQLHGEQEGRCKAAQDFETNDWCYAEQPHLRKDGSIMTGKLAARKVRKPDGTVAYFEGIVEDITERKKIEEELKVRTVTLEEVNTALKVLMRQIGEDKKEMEDRFVTNIKSLVLPYVERVKVGGLDTGQQSCLDIIEENLNSIVSTFVQSVGQFGLTPRETQVAALIRDGKTTKEMAEILGLTPSAVDTYRNKVRRKLNLTNKKINLQSFLQSIK